MKPLFTMLAALSLFLLMTSGPCVARQTVTVGYQLIYNPWKYAIKRGDFQDIEGYTIEFRKFDSPGKLLPALLSGDVQIGLLGSTGVATAMSRGMDVELVWILEAIEGAEALVAREGSGVIAPQDLRGKRIGVPFVSTTHFHTLFALEQFNIPQDEVTLLNMPPNAIAAAWERGDIDAAFVWNPALGRIRQNGTVLVNSGLLGDWGKPTFDGLVALQDFSSKNPEFMRQFLQRIAAVDAEYRNAPQNWGPESEAVRAIVDLVGGEPKDVPAVLANYGFPAPAEQVSCAWLGCGKNGGAARALQATARFLELQKKIPKALDDYSSFVTPTYAEALVAQ